ncbi:hypothetical protein CRG98_045587 [Punica granatum]|uniref:Uncharacterized protein n=1 Tax=Punica granatum TaxID=22663 RepID=A0A2I0HQP1_PUNGR|nr:hypothetical protein CRG98_045587 [Punica granatum]
MHWALPHLPVNLEWLTGFDRTLAYEPTAGSESNLWAGWDPSRGLDGTGRTKQVRTVPCCRPCPFILLGQLWAEMEAGASGDRKRKWGAWAVAGDRPRFLVA